MKHNKFGPLAVLAALAVVFFPTFANGEAGKAEPVKIDLYVMSHCPFGLKAENAVFPAIKSLGEHVDLKLHFIASETPPVPGADAKNDKPTFTSMHGPTEVEENLRDLCAMKHFPKQYMDFILARNENIRSADWQSIAKKVGIDPSKMEACSTGDEGAKLLSDSIKITTERKANASPTIDVNGSPYTGPRGQRSITLAVCDILSARGLALPDACEAAKKMPADTDPGTAGCGDKGAGGAPQAAPPVPFDLTVLTDKTCTSCQLTLISSIKKNHPGANIVLLDVNSKEGQDFLSKHDVPVLPAYFLGEKVAGDANFPAMKGYYVKSGDGYMVRPGSDTYTPSIQMNRTRVPRHLDVFVESNSQFTAQVEAQLMKFLAESDVKDLTFSMHYIVQETAKGEEASSTPKPDSASIRSASLKDELKSVSTGPLTSRRGETELQESMRQVCLFQHASIGTFFTYLTCRNQNILDTSRGDTCLQLTEPLKQCLTGPESENLLRQDAHLVRELGITSGPVFLWENRNGPFGWHEVDWKKMIAETKK